MTINGNDEELKILKKSTKSLNPFFSNHFQLSTFNYFK